MYHLSHNPSFFLWTFSILKAIHIQYVSSMMTLVHLHYNIRTKFWSRFQIALLDYNPYMIAGGTNSENAHFLIDSVLNIFCYFGTHSTGNSLNTNRVIVALFSTLLLYHRVPIQFKKYPILKQWTRSVFHYRRSINPAGAYYEPDRRKGLILLRSIPIAFNFYCLWYSLVEFWLVDFYYLSLSF